MFLNVYKLLYYFCKEIPTRDQYVNSKKKTHWVYKSLTIDY